MARQSSSTRRHSERESCSASTARGGDDGAKASTILQFRRLAEVLGTDMEAFVDELGARNVALFSGHLFRGKELDAAAQEATEAEMKAYGAFTRDIQERIRELLPDPVPSAAEASTGDFPAIRAEVLTPTPQPRDRHRP